MCVLLFATWLARFKNSSKSTLETIERLLANEFKIIISS